MSALKVKKNTSPAGDVSSSDSEDDVPLSKLKKQQQHMDMEEEDSDSEDDIPLAQLKKRAAPVAAKKKKKASPAAAKKKRAPPAKKRKLRKAPVSDASSSDDSSSSSSSSDDSDDSDSSSDSSDSSDSDATKKRKKKKAATKKRKKPAAKKDSSRTVLLDASKYETMAPAPLTSDKGVNKWWNNPSAGPKGKGDRKWTTFQHNGILFPPAYEPHGVKMLYDGKPVTLTPEQEEVATWYAVMLESDHVQKKQFNDNFFRDWQVRLGKNHVIKSLAKCDFRPIHQWAMAEREAKKIEGKKADVKAARKKAIDEEKAIYGHALVDGYLEKTANYKVEIPGLFRGRGEHPKTGSIKKTIMPEDVVLNIGEGVPLPQCPLPGHQWKGVVHNNKVTWLAYWKDPITKSFKYVFLASDSQFKGSADRAKYEKARKLKKHIGPLRDDYNKKMKSSSSRESQLATSVYLIDKLALRVGNEKDTSEEADTVGCCSLRVEHLKFLDDHKIEFDFLGKDSMRYLNTVSVPAIVYDNMKSFCEGKPGDAEVFDMVDSSVLNDYLRGHMPGLSAKVFRTYNASVTLEEELYKNNVAVTKLPAEKVRFYNQANREVSILCNHQRSIPKGFADGVAKLDEKIAIATEKVEELEDYLAELEGKPVKKRKGKKKQKKEDKDATPKRRSKDPKAIKAQLKRAQDRLQTIKSQRMSREDTKTVSLTTAKINYMDPRITVAWCKDRECPIEKIFPRSMAQKFPWAMEVAKDWRF